MADQSDPNYQAPVYPENSLPDQGTLSSPEVSPVTSTEIPVYEPPETTPPEESPTVVVSNQNGGTPKWFYFLFAIVLIVFFLVTALLVLSYTGKQVVLPFLGNKGETATPVPLPTNRPAPTFIQETPPSANISPAVISPINLTLPDLTATDETADLEKDINNTDFSQLDKAISALDREMVVTSF